MPSLSTHINKIELAAAQAEQVDVLSPKNFRDASVALSEAKASRDKADDTQAILDHVAEGRAHLGEANETALVSRPVLDKVMQARRDAIVAGAPTSTKREFHAVEKDLTAASAAIERNDRSIAEKTWSNLSKRYGRGRAQNRRVDVIIKPDGMGH